jgi:hypothetical protein
MAFTDSLNNLDIGSTLTTIGAKYGSSAFFFGKMVIIGGLFALLCFIIYKMFFEYNIRVTLVRRIGEGALSWSTDNAKIKLNKDDGARELILMRTRQGKNRISTQVPSARFKGRKGKKDHYFLFMDDNYQLQVIQPLTSGDFTHPFIQMFAEDKRWWARKEDKRRLEKYVKQSALDKYLPSIIVITAFIITFFIAYFGFTYLGNGMNQLAGAVGQMSSQCSITNVGV